MKYLKKSIKILLIIFIIFILSNIGLYIYCLITPKIEINQIKSYYLYDNNNELVFDNNNDWITLDKISPYLINATISTEDKYFYKHIGFDYFRIIKAAFTNIINKDKSEGASTITQQYARNLFLNFDKTWKRKIDEAILAFELETHYTKDEILEGYLNTINYGGIFGVENASYYYFGKSASDLNLAEASILAGIPQSPSYNSPLKNPINAKNRQKTVLTMMKNNKKITNEEFQEAINTNLEFIGKTTKSNLTTLMYFKDAVIDELKSINSIPNSLLETGGLRIHTTLDIKAQESLENSLKKYVSSDTEIQTSGIMVNPSNGSVLALIGGNDYNTSQYNRALYAKRQVGSTMKPILYYAALENGLTSASSFTSEKTTFTFSTKETYSPSNYNDTYAKGPLSMGAAISYSDNIYAVKTHLFLGEETLVNMAKRLGIKSELSPIPSLALGTEEISLIEMTEAYSTFANLGYKIKNHFITKVEDSKGNILYEYNEKPEKILDSNLTYILNEMLTYTYDTAFIDYNYPTIISLLPRITHKYSIKSGTTDTDLWILGYNQDVVVGIWNGYDDNKLITSEDTHYHKNIWIDTIESYLKDKETAWYKTPSDVIGVMVNPITGKIATENNNKSKIFYFLKGTEPTLSNYQKLESIFKEEKE